MMLLEAPLVDLACPAVREMVREAGGAFDIPFDGPDVEAVCSCIGSCVGSCLESLETALSRCTVSQLLMAATLGDYLGSEEMVAAAGTLLASRLRLAPPEYIAAMFDLPFPSGMDLTWLDNCSD
jgi:hypothetical protein